MEKTVVVTGGAGYVGSHICKALKKTGILPIVVDNLTRGHRESVKWGPLFVGNVSDKGLLKKVFEEHTPKAVIHCAAYAYVQESYTTPDIYYRNNAIESLALLEAMQEHAIPAIIFSSTCSTYGEALETPISEQHPQQPINPYGRSKLMVEWMIKDFAESYGLKYGILRYFNVAGADLEGEIGENHHPETHLIPLILRAASENAALSIFGTDFPTPDGSCVRDYIHVQDLADGHVKALEKLAETGSSFAVNLGSGKGISVKEMAQEVEKIVSKKVPVRFLPRRKGDPPILVSNIDKAKTLLGWTPKHSDITTILSSAWMWECILKGENIHELGVKKTH